MTTKTKAYLQAEVNRRITIAGVLGAALSYIAWVYYPFDVPVNPTVTHRLVFTLRWLVLSLTPTVLGVHVSMSSKNLSKCLTLSETFHCSALSFLESL